MSQGASEDLRGVDRVFCVVEGNIPAEEDAIRDQFYGKPIGRRTVVGMFL